MYGGIYLVFIRSLCIFVDILTVCYTFIHFLSLTRTGCQVASYVAKMTTYFEKQNCLNIRRRIDDCLREVSL